MKKYISKIKTKTIWGSLFLAAGIFLGWVLFHPSTNGNHSGDRPEGFSGSPEQVVAGTHDHPEGTTWTCSMHPQIRREEPGQCPICGMDLIPVSDLDTGAPDVDPEELGMTESAAKLAEVQTLRIERGKPVREILLQGKVKADERRISVLTARFGGRIEKLYVSFTGEQVQQGERLALMYSPELVTAQRELIEAARGRDEQPGLYRAARSRLELWDLTGAQIDAIIEKGEPELYFDVRSPIGGTVTKKHVSPGDYVNEGSALFEVIDLTRVWIMFDAYESNLPWISKGDMVSYQVQSIPGLTFTGRVAYIDPFIHPETRVAGIRVEQDNPRLILKPDMFVRGKAESQIAGNSEKILIPSSSILWTGKRAVVYVRVPGRDRPTFRYREITLGPAAGDQYVVESGLQEGEEIVVNGAFRIDAAAQLAGKPSMMNREGGEVAVAVEAFKKQLQEIFQTYISMKNAFVGSDPHKAAAFGQDVQAALKAADMDLLNPGAHIEWMQLLEKMNGSLENISDRHDIEIQRKEFAKLNQALYEAVKTFGLQEGTVYYQFCPMALDNKGAYWLSTSEEIRNPYFGDAMLHCGETVETFEF
ncbi:MAG TPA: efflux RND transporter periplasmic adaptor subunit [Bacteroides sp.]|nr:efflux RND transporter periplasmic adaptor subunit [Bacteroides sp.]